MTNPQTTIPRRTPLEKIYDLSKVWKEGINWAMKQEALHVINCIAASELGFDVPDRITHEIILGKARRVKNVKD